MTTTKKKPAAPVVKPFVTGSPTDERTIPGALGVFGILVMTVVMTFLVCSMLNMKNPVLRIGLNGLVELLILFILYNSAVGRGSEAVARGEILWQKQEKGGTFAASEKAMCFHPLKGYVTAALASLPILICALLLAVTAHRQTAGAGVLPGWMSNYQQRSDIGGALVAADGLGSNGIWVPSQKALGIHNYNDCWLDLIDFVAEGILMPFLAFLTSIVVGWLWGPKNIKDEIEMEGHKFGMYKFYWFCIKFVVPIAMIFVLLGQLDSFLSLGIFS